ncbi:MAG TPA: M14 metallopeptidase family protein [Pyrinomonadaceae bacterium]|nr:M14 metallopeptidase family protein [Pyrinomonadaceae bacterium]
MFTFAATAQSVPAPKDVLGFTPGDDRKLASWNQVLTYFQKLEDTSRRVRFEAIGKTTMDKPFVYATISAPANLKNLEKYKQINAKLADPRTFSSRDAVAKQLIRQGKTIVLITHGIHSTEVGSTLSSMLIAHRLATSDEPEIKKILENTIILLVPSLNPDGVDIVKNWYDKTLGTPFEGTEPPELYHKYVGHDNNRDWYAFTQVETQLTVDKIHNVWHPQIVHDIHQQGQNGSRLFLPPYMQPVEPNVPKQIVNGYTELGSAMAADLRAKGFQGITTNSTYDAWTPARAYSHYHGGVRILSETASARLATPVTKKFEDLRVPADDGYDPKKESANFGPLWLGGDWKLRNITDYMTTAAFSLLNHAADNREKWLTRFYEIGKEAVRPRKDGELQNIIADDSDTLNWSELQGILYRAGITFQQAGEFTFEGRKFKNNTIVIPMAQPYGNFAKALLENQQYPDLKDESGNPITPYDVTAHSLDLLMGIRTTKVYTKYRFPKWIPYIHSLNGTPPPPGSSPYRCKENLVFGTFKSDQPSMDEGWTRWTLERESFIAQGVDMFGRFCKKSHRSVSRQDILNSAGIGSLRTIIFPDQPAAQILNGYAKGAMPDEYTGGVGKEGVENLKKFVEAGGTLVFLNRSTQFAIEQFNLPIKDVTRGLNRKDFYIPGSILRTELDLTHPIARGMPQQSIAWFENSPAFEIQTDPLALTNNFRIIARYPSDPKQILLSGWALGAEKITGKAAMVEIKMGQGKIVLFGFRPQYRGQSLATFPLLFNAISQ